MSVSSTELLTETAAARTCAKTGIRSLLGVARIHAHESLAIQQLGRRSAAIQDLGMAWLESFHVTPESLFLRASTWLKQTANRRAALVESEVEGRRVTWFLKESVTRSWRVRLTAAFSSCRSENAWKQGLLLRAAGIATPRPMAVATFTHRGAYHEYLVTEAIPNALTLSQWLEHASAQAHSSGIHTRYNKLVAELARQLQQLHRHRFDHRDLKPTNILVTETEAGVKSWLIDLDGVWKWPILPTSRIVQNLARLWRGVSAKKHVRTSDGLRFLKLYLGTNWRQTWKPFWTQIARRIAIHSRRTRSEKLDSCQVGVGETQSRFEAQRSFQTSTCLDT